MAAKKRAPHTTPAPGLRVGFRSPLTAQQKRFLDDCGGLVVDGSAFGLAGVSDLDPNGLPSFCALSSVRADGKKQSARYVRADAIGLFVEQAGLASLAFAVQASANGWRVERGEVVGSVFVVHIYAPSGLIPCPVPAPLLASALWIPFSESVAYSPDTDNQFREGMVAFVAAWVG